MNVLKNALKKYVAYEHRRQISRLSNRIRYFGRGRECTCCKRSFRRFAPGGKVPRKEAQCPMCGSLERHRLIFLYMNQKTDLFNGRKKRMLHVAPEAQLSSLFQQVDYIDYLSADLSNPKAMVKMDVTKIQHPNNTFDVIYCSHVLEHVLDDKMAMREFHRVLKVGGWAILQVPITADQTFEDPSVISPEERTKLFGQHDHVRRYGPDYKDRLIETGFSVVVDQYARELDDQKVRRFGLMPGEDVYFCQKTAH